ncbi:unnamed protein product, partial [Vitis vinifera]
MKSLNTNRVYKRLIFGRFMKREFIQRSTSNLFVLIHLLPLAQGGEAYGGLDPRCRRRDRLPEGQGGGARAVRDRAEGQGGGAN